MVPLIGDNTATLDVGAASRTPLKRIGRGGFSLVEVTLAIGIVAFAFMAVLGLIPVGMKTFRSSINTSVSGQIFQRIVNEAQQTDFDTLTSTTPPIRYFDDQGNDVGSTGRWIYTVNTRISPSTALPSGDVAVNANLATITVQIANNPGNLNIDTDPDTNLWVAAPGVSMLTHSTMVARNK